MHICIVCGGDTNDVFPGGSRNDSHVKCKVCGEYYLSEIFARRHPYPDRLEDGWLLSGAIRENFEAGRTVTLESSEGILDSVRVPRTLLEKLDKLLLHISKKQKSTAEGARIHEENDYALAYCRDQTEFHHILVLAQTNQFIEPGIGSFHQRLRLDGWKRVEGLDTVDVQNNKAFIAMWFNRSMFEAWENGIKPALESAGYDPVRVDRTHHNDKIDDRIIMEIRQCSLVVADFTGDRGGVYFEAGFAKGLGKNVIWTCRKDWLEKIHFDTRQYNHITWEAPADLYAQLYERVQATYPLTPRKL